MVVQRSTLHVNLTSHFRFALLSMINYSIQNLLILSLCLLQTILYRHQHVEKVGLIDLHDCLRFS